MYVCRYWTFASSPTNSVKIVSTKQRFICFFFEILKSPLWCSVKFQHYYELLVDLLTLSQLWQIHWYNVVYSDVSHRIVTSISTMLTFSIFGGTGCVFLVHILNHIFQHNYELLVDLLTLSQLWQIHWYNVVYSDVSHRIVTSISTMLIFSISGGIGCVFLVSWNHIVRLWL